MALEAVNIDVKNNVGALLVGVAISVFDLSNALQDSGVTDANGRFSTTLQGDTNGITYKAVVTGDGIAGGNAQPITVVS